MNNTPIDDYKPIFVIPGMSRNLPTELELDIFSWLPPTDLVRASLVARTWKALSEDNTLNLKMRLSNFRNLREIANLFVDEEDKTWITFEGELIEKIVTFAHREMGTDQEEVRKSLDQHKTQFIEYIKAKLAQDGYRNDNIPLLLPDEEAQGIFSYLRQQFQDQNFIKGVKGIKQTLAGLNQYVPGMEFMELLSSFYLGKGNLTVSYFLYGVFKIDNEIEDASSDDGEFVVDESSEAPVEEDASYKILFKTALHKGIL